MVERRPEIAKAMALSRKDWLREIEIGGPPIPLGGVAGY
jgi:hypothetical protein